MKGTGGSVPSTTLSRHGLAVSWYLLVQSMDTPESQPSSYYGKVMLLFHGNVHPGFSEHQSCHCLSGTEPSQFSWSRPEPKRYPDTAEAAVG